MHQELFTRLLERMDCLDIDAMSEVRVRVRVRVSHPPNLTLTLKFGPGRARRGAARAQGAGAAVRGAERPGAPGREGAEHPAPEELSRILPALTSLRVSSSLASDDVFLVWFVLALRPPEMER